MRMIHSVLTREKPPSKRSRKQSSRPEFVIDETDINKEYFLSFAIIISTLITEKTPLDPLPRGPTNPGLPYVNHK